MSFEDQLRAALDSALAEMRPHLEDELRPCIQDVARAAADASSAAAIGRVAVAIRGFDAARSLGDTLDALAQGAAAVAPGTALFMVSAGRHSLWRGATLDGGLPPASAINAGVPVRVGGTPVAFLHGGDSDPVLEILARHAGKVLEALTMQQAVGL